MTRMPIIVLEAGAKMWRVSALTSLELHPLDTEDRLRGVACYAEVRPIEPAANPRELWVLEGDGSPSRPRLAFFSEAQARELALEGEAPVRYVPAPGDAVG